MGRIVGIDTGGTFTDLVALAEDGTVHLAKEPSSPDRPADAFARVLEKSGIPGTDIERLVHGTTVAANAIIQRKGARLLFVSTSGFEDIPFIQRINRERAYDLHWVKPEPLVLRSNCMGLKERCGSRGEIILPLEDSALEDLGKFIGSRLERDEIDAISVCLLFSFLNPTHEIAVGAYLEKNFPRLLVSLSHQVAPVWREYERSSTVLADAFVKPLLDRYCIDLVTALEKVQLRCPCALLKSNGGTSLPDNARKRPVDLIFSGMAGGVVGGRYFARRAGFQNAITFDMGGTSCDVGIIIDGDQQFSTEFEIEWGLPVAIPTIEVRTLGAGGGSIAWIDKGGLLNVGPQSAGGDPGPACYGAGGTAPTVTDANLLLGRLNPLYFLGGEVPLDFDLAAVAMDGLAVDMGVSRIEAAIAVIDIANENMTNAIRILSIELGIEPCDFALVAFGGAGPLHAAAVARKLGIVNVVVPPHPGLCSAFGAAISELRVEKVQTFSTRHQNVSEEEIRNRFDAISKEAEEELRSEGLSGSFRCTLSISMRYYQQNYEEDIEYRKRDGLEGALSGFHERHRRQYGYHFEDETIELVHFKVSLVEEKCSPDLRLNEKVAEPDSSLSRRSGYDVDGESSDFFVYRREALALASHLSGPAIVEEVDSTTFLPSGFELRIDGGGNFLLNEAPQSVTK